MAGRGGAPNTADSYIGSLISLTSKSEIRYEGILYTVDTENSNIAFQNVRSFGTEGRKKDGPQIPASEKVYDYIIFRGSDIKDLQVKSAPPPLQPPPPPPQPTDPAIISLQSQPHYLPPPSSLGYNGGGPGAGPSTEPSAPPPPPYMEMPPNQYQGPVPPPLYPPGGVQSWGPPPLPGGNAMPMYWQPYHRPPPPVGHMQHQPMPPQPPPSLAPPPQGQQQGAPLLPQPPPTLYRPLPPGGGPSSSAGAGLASHSQAASSSSSAQVTSSAAPAASAAPLIPSAPLIAATTTPASNVVSSSVSAVSSSASPAASSIGTTALSGAPVSASSSLPTSIQGVSAVITPMRSDPRRSDPRRSAGMVSQGPQVSSGVDGGSSSQGLRTQNISSGLMRAPREAAQSSGIVGPNSRAGVGAAQQQAPPKVEQKAVEPANVASSGMVQTPSQGAPAQEQVSQPLLPLPSGEQKAQQPMAQQRGGQGGPGGQRNRWQGNGYAGNGNFNRRGRGRGNGNNNGRGVGMANPARKFTEDFDFTAMNEKFNKTEVWGELGGGKVENAAEEEEYEDDEHVEDEIPEPESDKKALYKKDDFFDELSCDALDRERERGERTKFSEQRKIDTETFGAFPVRSRGRGGRGGRGGYRGGYFGGGGGSYGIGRGGNGYGRGRGSGRPGSAIP